jgi:hypothetical protein
MNISDFSGRFGFECVQTDFQDSPVVNGYTSDLLSDVMAKAGEASALITIQAHKNTVAVATLVGINTIVICNSRPIPEEMTASAKAEGIAIFRTDKSQFEVSGLLYCALRD